VSQVTLTGNNSPQPQQDSLHSLAFEGNDTAPFWLVVPTYNPGPQNWAQWLEALQSQQRQPARVVVVDSGSTDGSLALTERAVQAAQTSSIQAYSAFTLLHIKATQFDHGGTRQWALDQAIKAHPETPPKVVVLLTQDAVLANPSALQILLASFKNPLVAAAYGRQLPKPQASWLEAHARQFNYPTQSRTVSLQDKASLGFKVCFFSNAFGAYRLSALHAQGGLPAGLPLGEDTFTAGKLLLSGHSLHYQADAAVYHSHQYNGQQDFQRMFDTGVFHAQNPWLFKSFGRAEGEGWRLMRHQLSHLQMLASDKKTTNGTKSHAPSLMGGLFRMVLTNSLKLLGYKLGQWHRWIPRAIKRRLSMYKSFWQQQA
jgi:rhamnosyltransferase